MCGVAGIATADVRKPVEKDRVWRMCGAMVHRGPDDGDVWASQGIGLGSRRLAILDLSPSGRMPMTTEDGRFTIVYNGEIYNHQELRGALAAKGYRFRTRTDTEVLLSAFAEYGENALDLLNGMFAFAIWDSHDARLFLARDRLGVKPLYYTIQGGELVFASEAKALYAAGIPFEFDEETWPELLLFRYTAGERTPMRGIRRLLPGHWMSWQGGVLTTRRWWRLAERARARAEALPPDPIGWFRDIFDDAVALRRVADVPVGVLLSGGMDSSSVAASLHAQGHVPLASFTVRFAEKGYDEGDLAREVAERCGLDHHELVVGDDELYSLTCEASWHLDEPLAHGQDPHLLAISRLAKPLVTVLLSGEGADETLGGYVRYKPLTVLSRLHRILPALQVGCRCSSALMPRHSRLHKLCRYLEAGPIEDLPIYNAAEIFPNEVPSMLRPCKEVFGARREILAEARSYFPGRLDRQAMHLDIHTFLVSVLDRNDRMTMGASIECRVPFLDFRLVESLAAVPSHQVVSLTRKKPLLRDAMACRLPQSVLQAPKWGFGVPWKRYLREVAPFRAVLESLRDLRQSGPDVLAGRHVSSAVSSFLAGDDTCFPITQQAMLLYVWYQTTATRVRAMRFSS
ncbi:MAG: asparagine synthase (glutamine-hydrolyzing) [Acidobacteriota bacterium]